jgi:DUF4097 and DUF4098 domain-containing protein YvlB
MTRFRPVHAFALLGAVFATACSIDLHSSETSVREEKRFTVSGTEPVELELRTFDGAIQVRSWDRNEVLVEIERRGPDQSSIESLVVNTTQDGNHLVIEAPSPRRERSVVTIGSWVSQAVHFTVTAPRRLALQVRTADGSVEATDVEGTIDLRSGDGRILASRVNGQLTVRTGDGSIQIEDVSGSVDADSGDGSVNVAGQLQALDVRTGDGSVDVDATDGSAMKSDWRLTTGDGSITLRLPSGFNAEVEAHTGDGRIRVDRIDPPARQDEDDRRRRDVRGRLGSGGQTISLRTGDGAIDVH